MIDDIAQGNGRDLLGSLVAGGRLRPEEAELLNRELLAAERRGAARAGKVLGWGTAIIVALYCGLQVPWLLTIPSFTQMFSEMGLGSLPALTELVLSVPMWVYLTCGGLLVAAVVVKEAFVRNRIVNLTLNGAAIVAVMLAKAIMSWALFMPMIDMMQKLGS